MKSKTLLLLFALTILCGLPLKAADTYQIDPLHTGVSFSIRHLAIANVRGYFRDCSGTIVMEGGKIKEATGVIQVKSVDTGVAKRDDHLRTADFFDSVKHPTITFKTKSVESKDGQAVLVSDFTMHGVTRELRLPVKLSGPIIDPWGNQRIGLAAKAKLNRKDYGMTYNQVLETGGLLLGDEVDLEINAEAVKEATSKP